jgi:hypothetical protein
MIRDVKKMPKGDGTGPWGEGPKTGKQFGYCAGYPEPGYIIPGRRGGSGRGMGLGRGFGRGRGVRLEGRGRGLGGISSIPEEKMINDDENTTQKTYLDLRVVVDRLEHELVEIKARIAELSGASDQK